MDNIYIRLARDITLYVRMRGIYCKGHEGCIIQRITIVGIHDNNCTIIITAARAINRGWVHGSLYDGPIICRRWKPPRPLRVLKFCPLNHSRGRATSVPFGGRLSRLLSRLSVQWTNVLQRRKIQAVRCCIALQEPQIRPCDGVILISWVPAPLSIVSNHLLPRRFHPLIVWNTVSFYVCAMD